MDNVQITDEEIVTRTLQDKESFGLLISRYEERLTRYVRRIGRFSNEDVEDILQESFIKAYRYLNDFDKSLSFSSWMYRITHNEAISFYRKKIVRPEGHLDADSETTLLFIQSDISSSELSFDAGVSQEEIHRALQLLPAKYRDVIVLRFFEHKEYDEISDILKIPIGSVGTLLHRGKKQMGEILNQDKLRI